MALPAILDSVDELPEPIKQHYSQHESGKWLLGVEAKDGWGLENVSGLKSTLGKKTEEAKAMKARLDEIGDLDPAAAREAIAKLAELRDAVPEDKVRDKLQSLEQQLKSKHEKAVQELQRSLEKSRMQLDTRVRKADALSAIAKHKGNPDLLLPVVLGQLRLSDDEDPRSVVIDEHGQPRITMKQGSTEPMSVDEAVALMREDPRYMQAFEGTAARGSGSSNANGTPGRNEHLAGLSAAERLIMARRQGL